MFWQQQMLPYRCVTGLIYVQGYWVFDQGIVEDAPRREHVFAVARVIYASTDNCYAVKLQESRCLKLKNAITLSSTPSVEKLRCVSKDFTTVYFQKEYFEAADMLLVHDCTQLAGCCVQALLPYK